MADEAFALSPISARATLPSEEDYEAISQLSWRRRAAAGFSANTPSATATPTPAWCSTRWRGSSKPLAAQKQPAPDNRLAEALAAIRRAVDEARAAAAAAVENLAAGGKSGAGPQGHPDHQGNHLALAGNRRRQPDLRPAGFPGRRHRRRLRANRLHQAAGRLDRRLRSDQGADRGVGRQRYGSRAGRGGRGRAALPPHGSDARRGVETVEETSAANEPEAAIEHAEPKPLSKRLKPLELEAEAVAAPEKPLMRPRKSLTWRPRRLMRRLRSPTKAAEAAEAYDEALLDMVALEMAAPDPIDIDDAAGYDRR